MKNSPPHHNVKVNPLNASTTSDSASDAERAKPYRIKIATSTVKRHDRSFESSASETEVRFSNKGRGAVPVNYKKVSPLDIKTSGENEYHHPYAH